MIKLTVALPMFRAKYCGWIALESLIRQEDIDFNWELIVAEELKHGAFTRARLFEYRERLKKVRCVKIKYISLKKWMPLGNKFALMAKNSNPKSRIFATNSADLYSPPRRLKTQYDIFMRKKRVDFSSSGRTIVYDIRSERYYLNNSLLKPKGMPISDGSCRAFRMQLAKKLPSKSNRKRIVDGWIWNACKLYMESQGKKFIVDIDLRTDNWKYGLNVHGLNNLTFGAREARFRGKKRPKYIVDCPIDIRETIPKEILERLREAKKYLKRHKGKRSKK